MRVKTMLVLRLNVPTTGFSARLREDLFWKQTAKKKDKLMPSLYLCWEFPGGSCGKESACSAGDPGSIPGLGKSPGEGRGYPLQYSCPDDPMDRVSLVGYSPWGHKESDMTERLTPSLCLCGREAYKLIKKSLSSFFLIYLF